MSLTRLRNGGLINEEETSKCLNCESMNDKRKLYHMIYYTKRTKSN